MGTRFGGSLSTLHSGGLPADYLEKQEQKSRYARELGEKFKLTDSRPVYQHWYGFVSTPPLLLLAEIAFAERYLRTGA